MEFKRDDQPGQLELTDILERAATNAERQRLYREKRAKAGLRQCNIMVTDKERQAILALLDKMRG